MGATLYDQAGGAPAMLALADAHHKRCLAEPDMSHAFSHPDLNPRHVERLAAYWGEALGGPPAFSEREGGTQTGVLRLHACGEDVTPWGARFLACFVAAMDDAGLPDDPAFRAAMRAYMVSAVDDFLRVMPGRPGDVPDGLPIPRWGA